MSTTSDGLHDAFQFVVLSQVLCDSAPQSLKWGMVQPPPHIQFRARLWRPAVPANGSWTFLIVPKTASAQLPTRGITAVKGLINGHPFRAMLEPDGQKSHWLKLSRKMREAAGIDVGDVISLQILPDTDEREPRVPADVRKALAAVPTARKVWSDITPNARRDWIHWITSAKRSETRAVRIRNACGMLASGKRRVCCFDRSGFYSKSLGAPQAADQTKLKPRARPPIRS